MHAITRIANAESRPGIRSVLAQPRLVEARRHAEHRRVDVVVLARRSPPRRQHADRHERDADVGDERQQPRADEALEPAAADRDLAGEARGGVDARERHEREREGEDRSDVDGVPADAGRVGERVGVEQQRQPEHDDRRLQHEVGEHDEAKRS